MIRLAVTGAAGRMGKTLIQAIQDSDDLVLAAAFEHPDHPHVGRDAGELAGVGHLDVVVATEPGAQSTPDFDVAIDFTVPAVSLALAAVCCARGKALVIGTTGFTEAELAEIHIAAKDSAVFMAPNMSVGVNLMFKLIDVAARALGDSVDVEVIEAHHRHKVDAPSGTALRMGEVLATALGRDLAADAVYSRHGITGARETKTIGFSTLRGGDIVGEHTVMFAGDGERIEITHRAQSRMNFAQGALRAARFVHGQTPGLYDMQALLSL